MTPSLLSLTRAVSLAARSAQAGLLRPAYATTVALITGGSQGGTDARVGNASLKVRVGDAILPELDAASSSAGHLVVETVPIGESASIDKQARSNAEAIARVCDAEQLGGDAVDAVHTPFSATGNSGTQPRRTDSTPLVCPVGLMSSGDDDACSFHGSSGTPGPSPGPGTTGPGPGSPQLDPAHGHEVRLRLTPSVRPLPAFAARRQSRSRECSALPRCCALRRPAARVVPRAALMPSLLSHSRAPPPPLLLHVPLSLCGRLSWPLPFAGGGPSVVGGYQRHQGPRGCR